MKHRQRKRKVPIVQKDRRKKESQPQGFRPKVSRIVRGEVNGVQTIEMPEDELYDPKRMEGQFAWRQQMRPKDHAQAQRAASRHDRKRNPPS
jgi:hypothetical protein